MAPIKGYIESIKISLLPLLARYYTNVESVNYSAYPYRVFRDTLESYIADDVVFLRLKLFYCIIYCSNDINP